ncbi:MAG: hypothetical protein ABJO72_09880 [Hyphomicrobiales bacterium]
MKKIMNSVLGISLLVATSAQTTISFANDSSHVCGCSTATTGKIIEFKGQVFQSGKSGYIPASVGSDISEGSFLSVGDKSAAKISFGGCSLIVPSNSELTVSRTDNAASPICAIISSTNQIDALTTTFDSKQALYGADLPDAISDAPISSPAAAVDDGGLPIGLILLGAAVAGGVGYGIFELIDDDDDAPGAVPATP